MYAWDGLKSVLVAWWGHAPAVLAEEQCQGTCCWSAVMHGMVGEGVLRAAALALCGAELDTCGALGELLLRPLLVACLAVTSVPWSVCLVRRGRLLCSAAVCSDPLWRHCTAWGHCLGPSCPSGVDALQSVRLFSLLECTGPRCVQVLLVCAGAAASCCCACCVKAPGWGAPYGLWNLHPC